jgi:hypothetical protein
LALPLDQTKTFTGPKTRDYYQQSNLDKVAGALSFVRALGPSLPEIGSSLTKFLTGAAKNIDVGGGRTIEFDKNGNPTLKGDWQNVSGDLAGTLPTQAELESWGLVKNESGGYDSNEDASWADWSSSGDGVDYTDWWDVD